MWRACARRSHSLKAYAMPDAPPLQAPSWMATMPSHLGPVVGDKRSGSDAIFEIALQADASSFQAGYLGLEGFTAWVVGDVLAKLDEGARQRGYTKCTVSMHAVERVLGEGGQTIELYAAEQTLWEANAQHTHVPGALPFRFELTDDLPQCIHGTSSNLTYHVEARLHAARGEPHVTRMLLHPTRYTHPGPDALKPFASPGFEHRARWHWNTVTPNSRYSLAPLYWSLQQPVTAHFWLDCSVIRSCEPAVVQVHIPPPDESLVLDRGLKLSSVEAGLVRVTQSHPSGEMYSDDDILEYVLALQRARTSEQRDSLSHEAASSSAFSTRKPHRRHALVAFSGKSCRFHSQNPIHLQFALRSNAPPTPSALPAFDLGTTQHSLGDGQCESITQDTTLHNVRFVLCIRILLRTATGERQDMCTGQLIKILPAPAGPEADAPALPPHSQGQPSDASRRPSSSKHGKAPHSSDDIPALFTDQAEYDGYDDASQTDHAMRAMALSTPAQPGAYAQTIIRDPAHVQFSTTETNEPPPSIHDHVNDTRLPDALRSNPSYAAQLSNIPSTERTPSTYDAVVDLAHDHSPPAEELPNFEEVSQQPSGILAPPICYTLPMDAQPFRTWPAGEPPLSFSGSCAEPSGARTDALPPSYADSAPGSDAGATTAPPSESGDAHPPAYFQAHERDRARTASPPSEHSSRETSTPARGDGATTIFPPLYEA